MTAGVGGVHMIVQKQMLSKLKDFGLNSYEAKLWTGLLSRGVATAGELSDIANVPRSRSYDVLESLERKGFVIMKLGKPIKYIAVPPTEVVERVKKHVQEEADGQRQLLEELRGSDVLQELSLLHKQGVELVDPLELTGVVKGRQNLYHQLASIMKDAKKSVLIMTSEEGALRKVDMLKSSLQKAKDNGAKVRILAPLKNQASMQKALGSFVQIKHAEGPVGRFCVVDGKQVILMPTNDADTHANYDFGVWVNTPGFGAAMENVFNKMWEKD